MFGYEGQGLLLLDDDDNGEDDDVDNGDNFSSSFGRGFPSAGVSLSDGLWSHTGWKVFSDLQKQLLTLSHDNTTTRVASVPTWILYNCNETRPLVSPCQTMYPKWYPRKLYFCYNVVV
mmetsp:Transcript_19526/g.19861  ORF Transcript_19526/g.19861 Transcript_19526/m.19861 type:complete len:118 (+) Transcript_19526:684-1037(+)